MKPDGGQPDEFDAYRAMVSARRRRLRLGLAAGLILALCAGAGLVVHVVHRSSLIVAVAPPGSVESTLVDAFSEAVSASDRLTKLKTQAFAGLRDSAAALRDGRADLAVIRPDVALPTNGLTVAILQKKALIVASPATAGLTSLAKAGGKRLGLVDRADDDVALLRTMLGYYGLMLEVDPGAGTVPNGAVALVPIDEDAVAPALRAGSIDAAVVLSPPSAPQAAALVAAVASASREGHVAFAAVDDDDAIADRFPLLETMKIHGGLYGGRPKLPADDVKVVGASYRLQARGTLGRTITAKLTQQLFELRPRLALSDRAAFAIEAPSYDDTRAAATAALPNHPGAIDYYERDQESLIDRYSDLLYPVTILMSALISILAWSRNRVVALRRHRMEEIVSHLLAASARLRGDVVPRDFERLSDEIETLAAAAARCARDDQLPGRLMTAATIAIDGARRALARRRKDTKGDQPQADADTPPQH